MSSFEKILGSIKADPTRGLSELQMLKSFLNEKLSDEDSDSKKYRKAADLVLEIEGLDDETKEVISSVFIKIATDEESHNALLKTINDIVKGVS